MSHGRIELVYVVDNRRWLSSVSIPPLITILRVEIGKVYPSLVRFSNTGSTIVPDTSNVIRVLVLIDLVILGNGLQVSVVLDEDFSRHLTNFSCHSFLPYLLPILLTTQTDWLDAELPRTGDSCVFL